jgi:3,4-dihydroxy 2-butanone 4-phosphate synthase/GTP cyclohydrolase II
MHLLKFQVTPEAMAFMVEHTSGVICMAMEGSDLERLRLPLMVSTAENEEAMTTAFTITVDLKVGITTGVFGIRPRRAWAPTSPCRCCRE